MSKTLSEDEGMTQNRTPKQDISPREELGARYKGLFKDTQLNNYKIKPTLMNKNDIYIFIEEIYEK